MSPEVTRLVPMEAKPQAACKAALTFGGLLLEKGQRGGYDMLGLQVS